MTTTSLRASVRRRINQTTDTNTQFADAMIDELGDEARRLFASILPEEILTVLHAGEAVGLSVSTGAATRPADFLRRFSNKAVLVDSTIAKEIKEHWKWTYLESNDQTKSANTGVAYYRELGGSIYVYPSSATTLTYPYLRVPDTLDGSANADMPFDVDDLVTDYVFEKLMGTRRGDLELAKYLAESRGYRVNAIVGSEQREQRIDIQTI